MDKLQVNINVDYLVSEWDTGSALSLKLMVGTKLIDTVSHLLSYDMNIWNE